MPRAHAHPGRTTLALCSALALFALMGCSNSGKGNAPASPTAESTATSAAPSVTTIVIENFAFRPADLKIRPGARISVVNRDSAPHTLTAAEDKLFDTGTINGGATGTFTAPLEPGSYAYLCSIHPNMKGTLTVT
ncbi:cupredoxin domain-containing protein [Streptomyces sp. NPDC018833]|uniref:cupredoxin domain-containing protein n=1 Tax=Streptomyces sp. NPDC018833 TaxID=3365053 RepID=UPI0037A4C962